MTGTTVKVFTEVEWTDGSMVRVLHDEDVWDDEPIEVGIWPDGEDPSVLDRWGQSDHYSGFMVSMYDERIGGSSREVRWVRQWMPGSPRPGAPMEATK